MTTDVQKAGEVARHVVLSDITLRRASIETNFPLLAEVPQVAVTPKYRTHYEIPEGHADHILVTVDLDLVAQAGEPAGTANLSATFVATYRLTSPVSFDEAALTYFAALNGVYNVWPYWRELANSAMGRVRLGNVVMPVFRIEPKEIPAPTEAAPAAQAGT